MTWDLVIFDCDGVLVDSEPISIRILAEALGEIGLPMTVEETIRTFMGRSMASCVELIEERLGTPVPRTFIEDYHARTAEAFRRELRPVAGISEALGRIRWPTCVASSGDPEKIRLTLGLTGLLRSFQGRIFSATQVPKGKPAPDLFLHAARSLGANPSRCAVIEDSVPGVLAGVAAGMRVFGYAARVNPEILAAAGALAFTEMRWLPALLAPGGGDDRGHSDP